MTQIKDDDPRLEGTGGELRQRFKAMANLADRSVLALHDRQHLQSGDKPVASRRVVRQDDVAGLFAPHIVALLAHALENVAVADGRALQGEAEAG